MVDLPGIIVGTFFGVSISSLLLRQVKKSDSNVPKVISTFTRRECYGRAGSIDREFAVIQNSDGSVYTKRLFESV